MGVILFMDFLLPLIFFFFFLFLRWKIVILFWLFWLIVSIFGFYRCYYKHISTKYPLVAIFSFDTILFFFWTQIVSCLMAFTKVYFFSSCSDLFQIFNNYLWKVILIKEILNSVPQRISLILPDKVFFFQTYSTFF